MNDFRDRLQQAMADKNITASELSRISGVGKSDISNYLNGVYVAKQDKCYLLAKALNVDPGWLMTGYQQRHGKENADMIEPFINEEIRILAKQLDKLSPEQIQQAKNVFRAMFALTNPELFEGDDNDAP